ncbi:ribonuclease Oy-like [Coccinella septempunctata]|uniref:ribonuclease Oy-like n=1 Tax=Coccinella septempunctata TaxID=41139 RepID=UPI001D06CF92|nr:ribonuclease Oy-like [Coccinella septempunctata]
MMENIYCFCAILLVTFSHLGRCVPVQNGDNSFDYLLFDQHWPITECLHWKGLNDSNYCSLPKEPNAFNVHGLWPTKTGTTGPHSCSSQPKFDRKALDPILTRLKQRWMNVHGGTDDYSFWAHEWNKHGTCAKVLEPFNTEVKYFNSTLDLNSFYDIYGALTDYGITPGDQFYAIDDILTAIMRKFGKTPQIYCIFSGKQAQLHSVKLCFDKNINLIDCSSVGVKARNCEDRKTLRYLRKLPGGKW